MTTTYHDDPKPSHQDRVPILVWDLPTRLFHWVLVILVIFAFVTVTIGGVWMPVHMTCGYVILGAVVFRIVWGIIGGRYARFSSFVRGPRATLDYARRLLSRKVSDHLGHNPMGGWSVLSMLISLLVQALSGLFANDDIFTRGPLYHWVGKAISDGLTRIHRVNQDVLLVLVGLHLLAVFFYLIVKRDNLILPMITGYKRGRATDPATANRLGLAALLALLTAIAVWLLVR